MDDSNRTARVAMMWTPALKEAVREVAGQGGMTDWVIEAVEAKLAGFEPDLGPEEPREDEAPVLTVVKQPIETHVREVWKEPVAPPEGKPTNLTLEEALEPPKIAKDRDDLFARVMAKAGNPEELEKNKEQFSTASELPSKDRAAVKGAHPIRIDPEDDGKNWKELVLGKNECEACGSELVDGKCWWCG